MDGQGKTGLWLKGGWNRYRKAQPIAGDEAGCTKAHSEVRNDFLGCGGSKVFSSTSLMAIISDLNCSKGAESTTLSPNVLSLAITKITSSLFQTKGEPEQQSHLVVRWRQTK